MPRIPFPDAGGSIAPAPLPTPYASPEASPQAFGAGQAAALGGAADVAGQVFAHEREKVITAQSLKAEADIESGANDQILKFRQLKGADAGTQSQSYLDGIAKAREDYLGKIEDPSVRRIAEMRTYATMKQAHHQVGAWVAQQNDVAAEEGYNAKSASALTSVALAGADPVLRQQAVSGMQGPLLAEGRRQGLAGSPTDASTPMGDFFAKWNATAAKTSVESMLGQGLVTQAQAFMAQPGARESIARLGPDQLQAIENRIKTHADVQGAITDGLGLVQKYTRPGTTLFDEQKALADAGAMDVNPERKLKTIELIEQQANRLKGAQAQKSATVFEQARSIYEKTGTLTPDDPQQAAVMANAQSYLLNPVNQATGLWESLRDRARLDARRDANDPPTPEERKNALAIRIDIADHPEKYIGMSPEQVNVAIWDKVAPRDFPILGTLVAGLQKRAGEAAAKYEGGRPPKQIDQLLIERGRDVGAFPSGRLPVQAWRPDQADLYERAIISLQSRAASEVAKTGKPPTDEKYGDWIEQLLAPGHVQEGGIIVGDSFETTRLQAQSGAIRRFSGKPFIENTIQVRLKSSGEVKTYPASQRRAFLADQKYEVLR